MLTLPDANLLEQLLVVARTLGRGTTPSLSPLRDTDSNSHSIVAE
jgi:hypothetical protein